MIQVTVLSTLSSFKFFDARIRLRPKVARQAQKMLFSDKNGIHPLIFEICKNNFWLKIRFSISIIFLNCLFMPFLKKKLRKHVIFVRARNFGSKTPVIILFLAWIFVKINKNHQKSRKSSKLEKKSTHP